jgi:hypothetical protein
MVSVDCVVELIVVSYVRLMKDNNLRSAKRGSMMLQRRGRYEWGRL